MPIYEYRCRECVRLTAVFTRSMSMGSDVRCEHCGSRQMARAVSGFAYHRSAADVIADLPPPGQERLEDYKDPRVIGRWVEKKFEEYGMDLPDSTRQMIDAAREGVMPDPIND